MSGAPLFTLVIFKTLLMFVLNFVLFSNLLRIVLFFNFFNLAIYSSDFHEGRQYFITLLMLVLNYAF